MKIFVALVSIILAVSALTDQEQWQHFKLKHKKVYKNTVDEKLRFAIFKDNLRIIETHNARFVRGEESYYLGANKFADLTNAEFKKLYLNYKSQPKTGERPVFERAADASAVPDAIDWRENGAVLGVKDQGQCGSCWAFSTTGSLEGQNYIKHNKKVSLSEQELVDCSGDYGNKGCNGGLMDSAFKYIKDKGISTEDSYKYTGEDGTCKSSGTDSGITLKSFTDVTATEAALTDAVGTVGPISAAMFGDILQLYEGGILNNEFCSIPFLDHAVLVVGYGYANGDFWIVKNSWGADWGEDGYFRLVRNQTNNCGIALESSYPTIA